MRSTHNYIFVPVFLLLVLTLPFSAAWAESSDSMTTPGYSATGTGSNNQQSADQTSGQGFTSPTSRSGVQNQEMGRSGQSSPSSSQSSGVSQQSTGATGPDSQGSSSPPPGFRKPSVGTEQPSGQTSPTGGSASTKGAEAFVTRVDQPDDCLRIRRGPSGSYEIIGCAKMGDRLQLNGVWSSDNSWAQLESQGWVYASQIKTDLKPPYKASASRSRPRSQMMMNPTTDNWDEPAGTFYEQPIYGSYYGGYGGGWNRGLRFHGGHNFHGGGRNFHGGGGPHRR